MVRIFTIHLLASLLILVACLPSRAQDSAILTVGEVYDFQVGDVFQYEYKESRDYSNHYKAKLQVLDKRYTGPNQDTLVYRILQEKLYPTGKFRNNSSVYKSSIDTIQKQYNQLSSPIFKDINPYEDDSSSPVKRLDTLWGNYLCNQAINGYELVWTPTNNYEKTTKQKWGKGLGLLLRMKSDNDRGRGSSRTKQLVFYNKQNGDSCGDRIEVEYKTTDKNLVDSPVNAKVYPNPADQEFTLQIKPKPKAEQQITIYDTKGRRLKQISTNSITTNVNISSLRDGLYILAIQVDDVILQKRLIKADNINQPGPLHSPR